MFLPRSRCYRSGEAVVTLFCQPPQKVHLYSVATPKAFGGAPSARRGERGCSAKDLSDGLHQEILRPAVAGLKSRFLKSRPFIGRSQLLLFVDVSFGGKASQIRKTDESLEM